MRIAYADPPYPGNAHLYRDHKDYAGEVDHVALAQRLMAYDGFVLHTSSVALRDVLPMFPDRAVRVMAWVKPFAAFKKNVSVAYAWEPVLVKACRKPVVTHRIVMRDWVSESITLRKGLVGVKPPNVVRWALEMLGAEPSDEFTDMFPGSGIVEATWLEWVREVLGSGAHSDVQAASMEGG